MITFASSLQNAIIYSVIFGINNAFSISLFGYIWARYFGRLHVGSIQGTGQMILVVGESIGQIPIAAAIDNIKGISSVLKRMYILAIIIGIIAPPNKPCNPLKKVINKKLSDIAQPKLERIKPDKLIRNKTLNLLSNKKSLKELMIKLGSQKFLPLSK